MIYLRYLNYRDSDTISSFDSFEAHENSASILCRSHSDNVLTIIHFEDVDKIDLAIDKIYEGINNGLGGYTVLGEGNGTWAGHLPATAVVVDLRELQQ